MKILLFDRFQCLKTSFEVYEPHNAAAPKKASEIQSHGEGQNSRAQELKSLEAAERGRLRNYKALKRKRFVELPRGGRP